MSPFSGDVPGALGDAGLLLGFFISLAIGSYLIRDNFLARMAQYVLVGAGLGYMAILVWRNVLWPRLFAPFLADPASWLSLEEPIFLHRLLPLLLGLLMWAGGVEMLRRPPGRRSGRSLIRLLAVIPAAVLAGVGLGVGLSGVLQGTLWPQITAALATSTDISATAPDAAPAAGQTLWLVRLLTLLITGGVLIHLHGPRTADRKGAARASSHAAREDAAALADSRKSLIGRALGIWAGVGRRALWLAAGIIFARLVAARLSLVLTRLDYFLFDFPRNEFWQILWAAVRGGGP